MVINDNSISAEQSGPSNAFDFSDIQESEAFYTDLDGEWNFFEQELLTPAEMKEQLDREPGNVVSIPSSFKTLTGEVNSFGTYSTTIIIPENYIGETLAVHIPYQYSAYTL